MEVIFFSILVYSYSHCGCWCLYLGFPGRVSVGCTVVQTFFPFLSDENISVLLTLWECIILRGTFYATNIYSPWVIYLSIEMLKTLKQKILKHCTEIANGSHCIFSHPKAEPHPDYIIHQNTEVGTPTENERDGPPPTKPTPNWPHQRLHHGVVGCVVSSTVGYLSDWSNWPEAKERRCLHSVTRCFGPIAGCSGVPSLTSHISCITDVSGDRPTCVVGTRCRGRSGVGKSYVSCLEDGHRKSWITWTEPGGAMYLPSGLR